MDKNEMVKRLSSPYASIARQLEVDSDFAERFAYVKDSDKYDWSKMIPKVTYDDWIVCLYKVDSQLYRINLDDNVVEEIIVVEVLEYDEHSRPVDDNGNVVSDDKLDSYCNNICCGESDDISCYIYFDVVNK